MSTRSTIFGWLIVERAGRHRLVRSRVVAARIGPVDDADALGPAHDHLGSDVAVDQAARVRVMQDLGDVAQQEHDLGVAEQPPVRQLVRNGRTIDQLHGHPRSAVGQEAALVDSRHAGMAQRFEDARLAHHLDRDGLHPDERRMRRHDPRAPWQHAMRRGKRHLTGLGR
jgi:hypothetical protein